MINQPSVVIYPPGNQHIPTQGMFESMIFLFPKVGYVSFLEGTTGTFISWTSGYLKEPSGGRTASYTEQIGGENMKSLFVDCGEFLPNRFSWKSMDFIRKNRTHTLFFFSNSVMNHELQVMSSHRSISGKQADEKKRPKFLICINFQEDSQ